MTAGEFIGGLGGLVAVATFLYTFLSGVSEYRRQGRIARAERFVQIRRDLEEDERFREIWRLIDNEYRLQSGWVPDKECDKPELLSTVSRPDREDYLSRLEEVGLLVGSGLLQPEVAHYIFGWRVMRTWESNQFWQGLESNRDQSPYFRVLKDLYDRSIAMDKLWSNAPPRRLSF